MFQSLIGDFMYRFGLPIIIIVCIVLLIGICIYALLKKKSMESGYKKRLEEKKAEKQMEENNT